MKLEEMGSEKPFRTKRRRGAVFPPDFLPVEPNPLALLNSAPAHSLCGGTPDRGMRGHNVQPRTTRKKMTSPMATSAALSSMCVRRGGSRLVCVETILVANALYPACIFIIATLLSDSMRRTCPRSQ